MSKGFFKGKERCQNRELETRIKLYTVLSICIIFIVAMLCIFVNIPITIMILLICAVIIFVIAFQVPTQRNLRNLIIYNKREEKLIMHNIEEGIFKLQLKNGKLAKILVQEYLSEGIIKMYKQDGRYKVIIRDGEHEGKIFSSEKGKISALCKNNEMVQVLFQYALEKDFIKISADTQEKIVKIKIEGYEESIILSPEETRQYFITEISLNIIKNNFMKLIPIFSMSN